MDDVHENDFSLDENHLEDASCSASCISNNEGTNNSTSGVDMSITDSNDRGTKRK